MPLAWEFRLAAARFSEVADDIANVGRTCDRAGAREALTGRSRVASSIDVDPPPGSDMDSFPTDVAEWEAEAGFELSASDRELMEHTGRDPDDLPSTFGTDATNWADPHQRQWFISNMFQQMHGDPVLFDGLDDLTRDSEWGSRLDYLPDTVSESSR